MSTFNEIFARRRARLGSVLCVGLDPDPSRLPRGYSDDRDGWRAFITDITRATAHATVAYKPNLAFFEALDYGDALLKDVVRVIREEAGDALIIADGKRGDIGNTARAYARAIFERFDFDAATVNPYMGMESLEPFYGYANKATIALCLTSNPGAAEYQLRGEPPLYEQVARDASRLNEKTGNIWLVAGATRAAEQLKRLRELAPGVPFLVPGIGAQGGDPRQVLEAAGPDVLLNVTRSVMYASETRDDTPARIKAAAEAVVAQTADLLSSQGR